MTRRCCHCGQEGTEGRPLESIGEMGESGGGSVVVAHADCSPERDPGPRYPVRGVPDPRRP